MRFETTPRWDADWKDLKPEHKRQFVDVVPAFNAACDAYAQVHDPTENKPATVKGTIKAAGKDKTPTYRWPAALRVSPMKSAAGIWEMTWSFASPDGRATFEFIRDDQGLLVRWRRIGDHGIYKKP